MQILYKKFEELTQKELEQILRLRQQVFVIEQQCFYEDIDGADDKAMHLMFFEGQTLTAYLRIFLPGNKFEQEASLGRIVVDPDFRGKGIGPALIKQGIAYCDGAPVRIEAQAALEEYYNEFGFEAEGGIYIVDGIDHLQMVLTQ